MTSAPPRLRLGQIITGDTGHRYRIDQRLGSGGYGALYRASRLAHASDRSLRTVCVKVCASAADWHGEAHMGNLLADQPEVVRMLDAFAFATGSRGPTRYAVVTEYLREGTVADRIADDVWRGWSATTVRREIQRLLGVLRLMHAAGVTHRDIKPDNVFLRDGNLVLGDFGIAKHSLSPKNSPVDAYTPAYTPTDMEHRRHWATWIDIYQVGLLACTLLTGQDWTNDDVSRIRSLPAPEDLRCWIWHATAGKGLRYVDGTQALTALVDLRSVDMGPKRGPVALTGHHVVVTGRFDTGTQRELHHLIEGAGGTMGSTVTDETTVLVRGAAPDGATGGVGEGRILFAVHERKRRGQQIHVIDETRLCKLVGLVSVSR
ncbi:protein kinase domain-containing protein [Gordonia sp. NPDC003376]